MIPAAILAGGLARRMDGADKSQIRIDGRTVLERVLTVLAPHCDPIAMVGRETAPAPLIALPDAAPGHEGPLAGILAALRWSPGPWIMIVPCDVPFLPNDLVPRLLAAREGVDLVTARSGGRDHPTVALWRSDLAVRLALAFAGGMRSIRGFTGGIDAALVDFATAERDPFLNLNRPDDVRAAAGDLP
jgi:molybdopterin-guanine dinucleotide biosynthesis protein A